MVKGYDPTTTDPSKLLLEYLLRWSSTPNPLPIETAEKYTKHWLKHSPSTSKIYEQFNTFEQSEKPEIKLKKHCNQYLGWSYWKVFLNKENFVDENYPSYQENNNQIVVCLNFINNKTELKENIDRELAIMLRGLSIKKGEEEERVANNNIGGNSNKANSNSLKNNNNNNNKQTTTIATTSKSTQEEADKQLMQSLYEGCRQGYKNYELDKEVEERISKKCAKYLFFRRSKRELPLDAKFRYASKVIEEVV